MINGWNDYFKTTLAPGVYLTNYLQHLYPLGMAEGVIPEPSETIVFGEKVSDSDHIHMDLDQGLNDEFTQLEHGRHTIASSRDLSCQVAGPRCFDLDHRRALVGEQRGGHWSGQHRRQIDDADAAEWSVC